MVPLRTLKTKQADEHEQVIPVDGSTEARLRALEAQQKVDHDYFVKVRETLGILHNRSIGADKKIEDLVGGQQTYVQVGVQLRRELYAFRDKFAGEVKDTHHMISEQLGTKLTVIDAQIAKLQFHVEESKVMEHKFTAYLESLETQRPQEGKTISEAFQSTASEVNRVKQLVQQFEHHNPKTFQQNGTGLTNDMLATMDWMYKEAINHAEQLKAIPELVVRVTESQATLETVQGGYVGVTQRVEAIEQFMASAGPASTTPPPNPPGYERPGRDGDGSAPNLRAAYAGGAGGGCHCHHVDSLTMRVSTLEAAERRARSGDPWHGRVDAGGAQPPVRDPPAPRADDGDRRAHGDGGPGDNRRKSLPLQLRGPLGAIAFKDRSVFDEKFTMQEDYRFNGIKNGEQWKTRVERYFISRAPILREILEFAELEDMEEITTERFTQAAGHVLTEDQIMMVNAGIWGFLAACLTGSAESLFERAEMLNGLDAWRRVVRHIDHGREIHLETLRREMKSFHNRVIKDVHGVEEGIANFENALYKYVKAGGTPMRDSEKKSDLLAILPDSLRRDLLWHATDGGSFEKFRDMILSQSQKVILNTRRGINAVVHDRADTSGNGNGETMELEEMLASVSQGQAPSMEELVAAVGRFMGRRQGQQQRPPKGQPPGPQPQPPGPNLRNPRKCPNCNKEHVERICPYPSIDKSQRRCWTCNQIGHSSAQCRNKKQAPIKAIEDAKPPQPGSMPFFGIGMVDYEGFTKITKGARPQPSKAALASFMGANSYEALGVGSVTEGQGARKRRQRAARMEAIDLDPDAADVSGQVHATSATPPPPPPVHETLRPNRRRAKAMCKHDSCDDQCCAGVSDSDKSSPPQPTPDVRGPSPQVEQDIIAAMEASIARAEAALMANVDAEQTLKVADDVKPAARTVWSNAVQGVIDVEEFMMRVDMVYDQDNGINAATAPVKKCKVASDSGAVANVIHPDMLPDGITFVPNTTGFHFVNAQGGVIEKFGSCATLMKGKHGGVGCGWQAADVARALHSVSQTTGTPEEPKQDVLYNASRCVVVRPGVVDYILKHLGITPVMEYEREGNLFTAEVELSSFPRQGAAP